MKRLVARSSLQRPYSEQILTLKDFFEFCITKIENIKFSFTTMEDYESELEILADRHARASTIAGTQKFHYFEPVSSTTLLVKKYSSSQDIMLKNVDKEHFKQSLEEKEISGYVTAVYNSDWYLACVVNKDTTEKEVTLSFLYPAGPAKSFVFPSKPDILVLPFSDVLTTASPTTQTGRTYNLEKKPQDSASVALVKLNI